MNKNSKKESELEKIDFEQKPLGKNNYIAIAIAGAMILLGFLLMLGGSSTEEAFNPDIFSTRRIIIAPAIAFLGFVTMAIAICIVPRKSKNDKK